MKTRIFGALLVVMMVAAACGTISNTYEVNDQAQIKQFQIAIAILPDSLEPGETRADRLAKGIASPESISDEQFQQLLDTIPPGEHPTFLDDLLAKHPEVDSRWERRTEDDIGILTITRTPLAPMSLRQLLPDVETISRVNADGSLYIELDGGSLLNELLDEDVYVSCNQPDPTSTNTTTYVPPATYPSTTRTTIPSTTRTTYVPCRTAVNEKVGLRSAFFMSFGLTLPYPIATTNGEIDDTDRRTVTWGPLEYDFDLEHPYVQTEAPGVELWRYPDVAPGGYNAEAIYWAVDQGIMETHPVAKKHHVQEARFIPAGGVTKTDTLTYLRRFNSLLGGPDSSDAAPGSASYSDIPSEADGTMGWAIHHNIAGTELIPPSCFYFRCKPGGLLNRGTAVLYISRVNTLVGGPTQQGRGHDTFVDVTGGLHYDEAIGWAAANGVARGFDNGMFLPSTPVTRGDLAVFMHRLYQQVLLIRTLTGE